MQLIDKVKSSHAKAIFHEALIAPKLANSIAKETGAKTMLLHPIGNVTKDEFKKHVSYIQLMKLNVKNLKSGLCN